MVTAPLTSRSEMDYLQSGYADDSKPSLDGFDSCVVHYIQHSFELAARTTRVSDARQGGITHRSL